MDASLSVLLPFLSRVLERKIQILKILPGGVLRYHTCDKCYTVKAAVQRRRVSFFALPGLLERQSQPLASQCCAPPPAPTVLQYSYRTQTPGV